jgi:hypothetical protein
LKGVRGNNAENWHARVEKLAGGRLLGRLFAASQARLREVAESPETDRISSCSAFESQSYREPGVIPGKSVRHPKLDAPYRLMP